MKFASLVLMSAILLWLVGATTLPYALAIKDPDLALVIAPDHPAALTEKAQRLRTRLLSLNSTGEPEGETEAPTVNAKNREAAEDTLKALPAVAARPDAEVIRVESESLRAAIRSLAERIIAVSPFESIGYRLLAEVTESSEKTRELMKAALARSRRESIAAFWLLNDTISRGEFAESVDLMDILLRTQPRLTGPVTSYMIEAAKDDAARKLIIDLLVQQPDWRKQFFNALPRVLTNVQPAVSLMLDLGSSNAPATKEELAPLLRLLVHHGYADLAYGVWYQLLSKTEQDAVGLLQNGSFEDEPTGIPFDWNMARGENSIAEYVPLSDLAGAKALRISFSQGRVTFPQISQTVLLAPGRYRLEGKLRGTIIAKRGLRWQIRCTGANKPFAETDMLLGTTATWRQFTLEVDVPEIECTSQTIALIHDARSPAERLIEGEVWFDDLTLTRLKPAAADQ